MIIKMKSKLKKCLSFLNILCDLILEWIVCIYDLSKYK